MLNTQTRTRFILFIMAMALLMAACKLPQVPVAGSQLELPAAFDKNNDTVSNPNLHRKQFFTSGVLNNLIDTVLARNYDLRVALQRIEMAKATSRQARAALLPQVNGTIVPSLRKFGLYTMDGAGNIVTDIEKGKLVPVDLPDFYGGFQASWEIDLWGKLRNRKKAALSRVLANVEVKNLIQTNLIAETATAYFELMAADRELRVIDETIRLQEQAIDAVRIQKQAAVVNELAVQQFEAQLLGLKSLRVEVLQWVNMFENQINSLAGRFPQAIPRDTAFFGNQSLPVVHAGIPSALLQNRPDIRQAEMELQASKADLLSARAAFLPSLTITGAAGLQAYRTGLLFRFSESIAYNIIGGLTGPLINRNAIKAEFAKANALQQEALLNYQKTINRAYLEVDLELKKIRNLQEVFEFRSRERDVLAESISVSAELFRTGRASYLEVLIARQNALRSNIELIVTKKNQYLSVINLYKSLGGGWQ